MLTVLRKTYKLVGLLRYNTTSNATVQYGAYYVEQKQVTPREAGIVRHGMLLQRGQINENKGQLNLIVDLDSALEGEIAVFDVGVVVTGGEAGLGDESGRAPGVGFSEGMLNFILRR